MSQAKYTPGPWEFLEAGRTEEEFNRGRALTIGGPRPNNDDLAQVFSRDDATVSVSREEAVANARLIATSPELLAVARDALVAMHANLELILEAHCLLNDDLTPRRDTLEEGVRKEVEGLEAKIERTRAVIAKATGAA